MRIYMAGAISGNLSPLWRSVWQVIKQGGVPNFEKELEEFVNASIFSGNGTVEVSSAERVRGYP